MRDFWQYTGLLLAIVLYGRVIKYVLQDKIQQSLATWGLWGLLDGITFLSIWLQDGNWGILGFYVLGCLTVFCTLIYKKQFHWTSFETFIIFL